MLRPALSIVMLVMSACSGGPPSAAPAQSGPAPDEAEPAPAADATAATAATPPATPPATPATPSRPAPIGQEHDDGGFADPKLGEESAPPPQAHPGMTDPALIARVKQRFGEACRPERSCGGMIGVDCNAAVDGPYYYVAQADLKVVSTCGGTCRLGCTDCPPKAWTCAVN